MSKYTNLLQGKPRINIAPARFSLTLVEGTITREEKRAGGATLVLSEDPCWVALTHAGYANPCWVAHLRTLLRC